MPLIIHNRPKEKCHQRASPMEWRTPGMPSHPGSVTASSFEVHNLPVGTAFWKRNHSVPGVQSRFQYRRGWSASTWTPERAMNSMNNRFKKCCTRSQRGKPAVTTSWDDGMPGYRTRKSFTAGISRSACATAMLHTINKKLSGSAQSTFIQRWPILTLGITPTRGGNHSLNLTRSSAPLRWISTWSCLNGAEGMLIWAPTFAGLAIQDALPGRASLTSCIRQRGKHDRAKLRRIIVYHFGQLSDGPAGKSRWSAWSPRYALYWTVSWARTRDGPNSYAAPRRPGSACRKNGDEKCWDVDQFGGSNGFVRTFARRSDHNRKAWPAWAQLAKHARIGNSGLECLFRSLRWVLSALLTRTTRSCRSRWPQTTTDLMDQD